MLKLILSGMEIEFLNEREDVLEDGRDTAALTVTAIVISGSKQRIREASK